MMENLYIVFPGKILKSFIMHMTSRSSLPTELGIAENFGLLPHHSFQRWRAVECGCWWGGEGQRERKLNSKDKKFWAKYRLSRFLEDDTYFSEVRWCLWAFYLQVTKMGGVEEAELTPSLEWLLERRYYYLLQQFKIFSNFRWDARNWNQFIISFWNSNSLDDIRVLLQECHIYGE